MPKVYYENEKNDGYRTYLVTSRSSEWTDDTNLKHLNSEHTSIREGITVLVSRIYQYRTQGSTMGVVTGIFTIGIAGGFDKFIREKVTERYFYDNVEYITIEQARTARNHTQAEDAERFLSEGRLTEALNNFSEAYRLSQNPNNYSEYQRKRDETNRQIQEMNAASLELRGEEHFGAYQYTEALQEFTAARDGLSEDHPRRAQYEARMEVARAELEAQTLSLQAEEDYTAGRYADAKTKANQAVARSAVQVRKDEYMAIANKAQLEITARALFEQAERLYSSGDYDGALNKYREAHSTSEVIAVKTACDNGITRAEVEIDARLAEERGDNIVTDGDLKEALAEYRQASERSMIKESEEQFRQEQDSREQTELSIVIIKSIQELNEELTSHELYRKGLDHKERGDEEYKAEDEGAAHEEYRKALGKFKEAMKCGKPKSIITALRELREAFSNLDAKEEVSDINRIFDDLVGSVPVITDIQTQNPVDQILGHHAEHNDSV